jgi:hypothetical protein
MSDAMLSFLYPLLSELHPPLCWDVSHCRGLRAERHNATPLQTSIVIIAQTWLASNGCMVPVGMAPTAAAAGWGPSIESKWLTIQWAK